MSRKPVNNFVVYAFYRNHDDRFGRHRTVYYIGKGRPNRPYEKKGRSVKRPNDISFIEILHKDLDEDTAFNYEKKFILFYGRADIYPEWGILRNLTDGGEGSSGYVMSEEQRKKLSEAGKKLVGDKNPNYGKKLSEERRKEISKAAKERFKIKENNPMYGKTHTPEVRKILSEKAKAVTGRNHPRTTLYDWTHPEYGDHPSISILELIDKFPDQELKYSSLYDVVKERCLTSKSWRLMKNRGVQDSDKFLSIKKLCTWSHPVHGVYENISAPDLVVLFPGLNRQQLNFLSNGKIKEYKKWTILEANCNNHTTEPKKSNWSHAEHGVFMDYTVKQLCEHFPDMNLIPSKLRLVRLGKVLQHKGWKNHTQ